MSEDVKSIVAEIPAMRRYAATLTRDRTAADDLVQDALERSVERFHQYQPGTRLRAWLFAVMRNIFLDQHRKRKKQELMADELAEASPMHTPPAQIGHLVHQDLVRQLESLKPEYRELLLLVGPAGVSYEDAAALTGVPLGTVRSRLFRARNMLLNRLEGEAVQRTRRPSAVASANG